jgi:hypothetical protein
MTYLSAHSFVMCVLADLTSSSVLLRAHWLHISTIMDLPVVYFEVCLLHCLYYRYLVNQIAHLDIQFYELECCYKLRDIDIIG